jgi:hypothetical protein
LEVTKYLVGVLVKCLAGMLAERLADMLLALEETRDVIGLVVLLVAVAVLSKPADPLDNIKSYNILLIGLGILAKYIYGIFIIVAAYSI